MLLRCRIAALVVLVLMQCLGVAFCEHGNPITTLVQRSLEKTAKNCMVHVNATEADLEYLKDDPPFPEKAACIVKCLLEKIGIVKNNKYSRSGFMAVLLPLVLRNKKKLEHMKMVSDKCDKEVAHHEVMRCQLGNDVTACIFKYAPELHFNKRKFD